VSDRDRDAGEHLDVAHWSGSAGESEQLQRVVVGRARLGLEDAEAKSVVEVQHLVAEGEVTDLGMVERLGLAAPVPEVVAPPQQGELGAAGRRGAAASFD